MGATVHIDTDDAERRLRELARLAREANTPGSRRPARDGVDPAEVAQAKRRYDRRNGTS